MLGIGESVGGVRAGDRLSDIEVGVADGEDDSYACV